MRSVPRNKHVAFGHPSTAKQRRFCEEYIKDYNAQAAAARAGFNKFWLQSQGYRLLKTWGPYLAKLQDVKTVEVAKFITMNQADILREYAAIAMYDPRDYFEEVKVREGAKNKVRKVHRRKSIFDLSPEQARLVENVRIGRHSKATYSLPNMEHRMRAIEQTGRHYGMFHDKFIAEHLHAHLHLGADLSSVDGEKLKQMEAMLIKEIGAPAMRLLGYTPAQAAEAIETAGDEHGG